MRFFNSRVLEYIKRWGIFRTFYYFVMECVKRYFGFVLCAIAARPLRIVPALPNADLTREYRLLTESELIEFSSDPEVDMNAEKMKSNFAKGDICVGAIENGELIAYLWSACSPTKHVENLYVDFGPKARYLYKGFTRPAYRGQRIQSMLSSLADDLSPKDRTHSITFIETHNYASIHTAKYHGNKIIGYAGYWKLFGRYIVFHSRGARKLGFRFFIRPAAN